MKHDDWNQEISLDEMLADELFQRMVVADKHNVLSILSLFKKIAEVRLNGAHVLSPAPILRTQSH